MGKFIDLTGQKFERLKVVECSGRDKKGRAIWKCQCKCGKTINVSSDNLRRKHTKSCGCLHIEKIKDSNTRHGASQTRLFKIWVNMKKRCLNKNCHAYKDYGGRGIMVCEEWLNDFVKFKDWAVKNGYKEDLTIDRKNNNGNYSPDNCRWTTIKVQANNTRHNRIIYHDGEFHTMKEWAVKLNINYRTLSVRINRDKWDTEKALTYSVKT